MNNNPHEVIVTGNIIGLIVCATIVIGSLIEMIKAIRMLIIMRKYGIDGAEPSVYGSIMSGTVLLFMFLVYGGYGVASWLFYHLHGIGSFNLVISLILFSGLSVFTYLIRIGGRLIWERYIYCRYGIRWLSLCCKRKSKQNR